MSPPDHQSTSDRPPRLSRHLLRIGDPERSLRFYRERLGLQLVEEARDLQGREDSWRLAFPATEGALLELRHLGGREAAVPYLHGRDDLYWKIGITLPDVDLARTRLLEAGVAVDEARQFRDIGYLCHLADPDGFQIELLQHRFQANHRPQAPDPSSPLGQPAGFGQITIRVGDPAASLAFYQALGLRLLSIQPVAPYGFTLYFLASTAEAPPVADLEAVENREWLWQRPYPTLELQHRWGETAPTARYRSHDDQPLGFAGLAFSCPDPARVTQALQEAGFADSTRDPDGTRIWLREG